VERFPRLDRDDELRLAKRFRRGHQSAGRELVQANLRFVVQIARSYRGYGLKLEDLIEEGNIGLLEAVRRFDPTRNLRFMTYAAYWIRAYILSHVLKQWSLVATGTGPLQSKLFFRMARERAKISAALGAQNDTSTIENLLAKRFGTSVERVRNMTDRLEHRIVSLDSPAFRSSETVGLDLLPDPHEPGDIELSRREQDERVRQRISTLTGQLSWRERYILQHRLFTDDAETLASIGRHFSLSRERVRQLETQLKRKLRRALAEFRQPA
jgi:RNA polymerase sigma-32 factor